MPKSTTAAAKKPVVKKKPVSNKPQLVKKFHLKGRTNPVIKRSPPRTAIARHIAAPKSYAEEMIERYGG